MPFILRLNFITFLQGGITIQNNQVRFHPKSTTIDYIKIEKYIRQLL